jgi:hypothetical protein
MGYEQATIPVENAQVFERLKAAIVDAVSAPKVERFLSAIQSSGLHVRDFEAIAAKGAFARVQAASDVADQYQQLGASDQGQIREFYLTKIEEVESGLRQKFYRIFRYS